jgi:lipoprotein-anchoring transpeptidase ErfK/SrfK
VPTNTIVATPTEAVQGYASPGGPPTVMVPRTLFGATLSLPVIGYQAGYSDVRLPTRPDGSTAWIKNSSLVFSETPWAIVVHLATTHLTLYRSGKAVATMPVGVGTAVDPTPTGSFFLVLDERPLGPGYGPFIMVTSAHSHAIRNWAGSGDAWVAIHGPLGAGPEIGTTGARVSHGCVRLHTADVGRFRGVLPGSPIYVIG